MIELEIYDILRRRIVTLVDDYKTAGSYEQVFDASSIASRRLYFFEKDAAFKIILDS